MYFILVNEICSFTSSKDLDTISQKSCNKMMSMIKQNEKYCWHEKLCACFFLKRVDHIF